MLEVSGTTAEHVGEVAFRSGLLGDPRSDSAFVVRMPRHSPVN